MNGWVICRGIIAVLFVIFFSLGCSHKTTAGEEDKGFYVEAFQLAVPKLHGFARVQSGRQDTQEIFLLERGEARVWLSVFKGILIKTDTTEALKEMWGFAQSRVYNLAYLKGVKLQAASFKRAEHPTRPYLEQILIAERIEELQKYMDPFDKELYAAEFAVFPVGRRMILANYYLPVGDSVYALSFAAPPDDFLFFVEDVKKIFLELEFDVAARPPGL
jgi:hypothetical protein